MTKLKRIDETPPKPTGDLKTDYNELRLYTERLIETMNYNYFLIEKEMNDIGKI